MIGERGEEGRKEFFFIWFDWFGVCILHIYILYI
jgi:hypothetical protein